jgi:hypothetical protein
MKKRNSIDNREDSAANDVGLVDFKNHLAYSSGLLAVLIYICLSAVAAFIQLIPSYLLT